MVSPAGGKTLALFAGWSLQSPGLKTELSVYFLRVSFQGSTSDGRGYAGESAHRSSRDRHRRRLDDREGGRRRPDHQGDPLERLPAPPDQAGRVRARLPGADRAPRSRTSRTTRSAPSSPARAARRSARTSASKFVQEVNAVTLAVETLHPDVGSVLRAGRPGREDHHLQEERGDRRQDRHHLDERQVRVGHRRHDRQVRASRSACPTRRSSRSASTTRSCTTWRPSAACSPRPTSSTW